jgi:hypothetical protein
MRELFYVAPDASNDEAVWVSDASGIREIDATGAYGPALDPTSLIAVGDNVYFFAMDNSGQEGLWVIDAGQRRRPRSGERISGPERLRVGRARRSHAGRNLRYLRR